MKCKISERHRSRLFVSPFDSSLPRKEINIITVSPIFDAVDTEKCILFYFYYHVSKHGYIIHVILMTSKSELTGIISISRDSCSRPLLVRDIHYSSAGSEGKIERISVRSCSTSAGATQLALVAEKRTRESLFECRSKSVVVYTHPYIDRSRVSHSRTLVLIYVCIVTYTLHLEITYMTIRLTILT